MDSKVQTSIEIDKELWNTVKTAAIKRGVPAYKVVEEALRTWLKQNVESEEVNA
jgi:hypothetical protein